MRSSLHTLDLSPFRNALNLALGAVVMLGGPSLATESTHKPNSQWGYFGRGPYEDDPLIKNKGPWARGKFTCTHEGGLRVPFFVSWKGRIRAGESDHLCALYDVLATAADLAGVVPPQTDGISLAPILLDKPDQQRQHPYLYWENGARSTHTQACAWINGGHIGISPRNPSRCMT